MYTAARQASIPENAPSTKQFTGLFLMLNIFTILLEVYRKSNLKEKRLIKRDVNYSINCFCCKSSIVSTCINISIIIVCCKKGKAWTRLGSAHQAGKLSQKKQL